MKNSLQNFGKIATGWCSAGPLSSPNLFSSIARNATNLFNPRQLAEAWLMSLF